MARDFRPKSARGGDSKSRVQHEGSTAPSKAAVPAITALKPRKAKAKAVEAGGSGSSDEDEASLLKEIKAMGGDESDLVLVRKGKGKAIDDDGQDDPNLTGEVLSFMKGLDFKAAGVDSPRIPEATPAKNKGAKEERMKAKVSNTEQASKEEKKTREDEQKPGKDKSKDSVKERAAKEVRSAPLTDKGRESKQSKRENDGEQKSKGKLPEEEGEISGRKGKEMQLSTEFVLQPTPRWSEVELPALPASKGKPATSEEVAALQQRGAKLLDAEKVRYGEATRSGKGIGPGMLSSSDARFISELLTPGAKGGTLSDRIAALTLLAQSSPVHNVDAMETLLNMAGKKGREESGRATRALADWLASGGGLSERKLRYFTDHPAVAQLAHIYRDLGSTKSQEANMNLLLVTFEDKLKRFYFQFLQILESQSHDTLPFVRKQAVTQIYLLLKEKSEQEQNLLRLLVNKLGDTDRAVASKASSSLLNILNVHPNMKAVITSEVSSLIMKPSSGSDSEGKSKHNSHARYYGILTLNQTMLTSRDEAVANRLVTLYFELFENVLNEMSRLAGGREEAAVEEGQEGQESVPKKQKQRWRDGTGKGKGKKGAGGQQAQEESKVIQDADAKTMAAILAGVRRALPFARVGGAIFEKHMTTLFRITHSSTFNISIQALQLIYQVSLSNGAASTSNHGISAANVEDRFYRALYASLLDPRLATTSKQAMYLNLLFKAIKSDPDNRRVKAFVKRFVQTLNHGEPPWICGGLFLLGELLNALPGLRTLLEEGEDDGEEHFVDAIDGSDGEGDQSMQSAKPALAGYDAAKREPQFAKAEASCLWELVPLLSHFHPSVSLHAHQLLRGERITTTADLTLNTLAHFLDRFVYRNPKKNVAPSKGASIMQPAMNVDGKGAGLDGGVVKLKGVGIRKDEFVNDERFWKKTIQEVPVDQLFFHKYFTQKLRRSDGDGSKPRQDEAGKDSESGSTHSEVVSDGEEDSEEDSEGEREIWKEMKRTMPRVAGDEMLDDSDDDDESDADLLDYDDSDDDGEVGKGGGESSDASSEESDGNVFDEDDDDLMPVDFDDDDDDDDDEVRGTKRAADESGDEGAVQSKSKQRREERKRRKALPTFASADEYAHLLGNSDDEDAE